MAKDKKEEQVPGVPEARKEIGQIDWVKRVQESGGKSFFVPENLLDKFKKAQKMQEDHNKRLEQVAKDEIHMQMEFQEAFFEMRKYLEKQGIPIWMKEIGLDSVALGSGEFVVNIRDAQ